MRQQYFPVKTPDISSLKYIDILKPMMTIYIQQTEMDPVNYHLHIDTMQNFNSGYKPSSAQETRCDVYRNIWK